MESRGDRSVETPAMSANEFGTYIVAHSLVIGTAVVVAAWVLGRAIAEAINHLARVLRPGPL